MLIFVKGRVTCIDKFFGYAILDNTKKIHFSILLAQRSLSLLPDIGSIVLLQNVHKHGQTFVVCNFSTCKGRLNTKLAPNPFIDFVRDNKLGTEDLHKLDEIMTLFETNFADINSDMRNQLILNILKKLLVLINIKNIRAYQCFNKLTSHLKIASVNGCRTVEILSNKYSTFPSWSFGIQSQVKQNTLLFGYLYATPTYCMLFLKDSQYGIPCVVTRSSTNEGFYAIINSFVLIKNYRIISEILKEDDEPNIEYVLVELENIFVVQRVIHVNPLTICTDARKFSHNMSFVIIKKSMPSINTNSECVCFLQISVLNRNDKKLSQPEIIFLIINAKFVDTPLYLFENHKYKLSFNVPLRLSENIGLSLLAPYNIYQLIDPEAVFKKIEYLEISEHYLTVEECKRKIVNSSDLLSFQGTITTKNFTNTNLCGDIKPLAYGFGTPGSKVQQVVFSYKENDRTVYLNCNLNNWENILMPLGLIPQMRVAVKNVLPQAGKDVETTALTTFEILSYEPEIEFQTVNLFKNDHIDWGPPFFLGHGNKIPYGVLVWGKVDNVNILSVDIFRSCKKCGKKNEIYAACSQCRDTEQKINFLLKMHVSDEYGESKVLVRDIGFLKYVLNIPLRLFPNWREALETIGEYRFTIEKYPQMSSVADDEDCFKQVITEYLVGFNDEQRTNIDLKCRKLCSDPINNGGRPLWLYMDSRKS